jgi:hypothetical protein
VQQEHIITIEEVLVQLATWWRHVSEFQGTGSIRDLEETSLGGIRRVSVVASSLRKGRRIDISTERTPEVRVLRILVHVNDLGCEEEKYKSDISQKISKED